MVPLGAASPDTVSVMPSLAFLLALTRSAFSDPVMLDDMRATETAALVAAPSVKPALVAPTTTAMSRPASSGVSL